MLTVTKGSPLWHIYSWAATLSPDDPENPDLPHTLGSLLLSLFLGIPIIWALSPYEYRTPRALIIAGGVLAWYGMVGFFVGVLIYGTLAGMMKSLCDNETAL